jgi:hypothetical protein
MIDSSGIRKSYVQLVSVAPVHTRSTQKCNFTISAKTDCSEALEMIKESTPNTSVYALCISVIRELLKERNFALVKISRDANVASHELARVGRVVYHRAQVWLMNFPVESSDAITNDCNFSKFNTYLFHRKNCNSTISSVYLLKIHAAILQNNALTSVFTPTSVLYLQP